MGYNMNDIKEYLKNNTLITDGSMGTFFASLKPEANYQCELGCLYDEDIIIDIHKRYIDSGAKLIRTNTFGANISNLGNFEIVKNVIKKAVEIAKKAVGNRNIFIGASIGPIADSDIQPYFDIIDVFIECGIKIFVFETFNDYNNLKKAVKYIKTKNQDIFILTQFALTDIGITKKAVSSENIIKNMTDEDVDALGFNCGVGPMHMFNIIKKINNIPEFMSALPNAGYPEIIDGKVEYVMNPKYFAKMVYDISKLGVKIVGGCCGTTPEHIKLLSDMILSENNENKKSNKSKYNDLYYTKKAEKQANKFKNKFHKSIDENKFLIAVELEPPFKTDTKKIIDGADYLRKKDVDIITVADSPMGKARADSIVISAKILRQSGIDTLPHICCRDRNAIALRSAILGAYIEGIRNFLIVTGDPVPDDARLNTKSVFNLSSYSLVNMVNEMNDSVFEEEKVKIGCAVNFNVKNKDSEFKRLIKKREFGAEFFLTQPIFSDDSIEYLKNIDRNRNYKILGGIMPLVSYKNAQFINNELPGINIPDEYINRFSEDMNRQEAQDAGIEIAVDIGKKIKPYVDGFYITTPFNRYEMVGSIIDFFRN